MITKEYLQEIKKIDISIDQMQTEFDLLKKGRTYIGGMDYSADRVQTSPDGSGFTKLSDKLYDMQKEINEKIDQFNDMRHKRICEIQKLSKAEYVDILFRRYVQYQSLRDISDALKFDYNYTCNLHGEALKEFNQKFLTFLK